MAVYCSKTCARLDWAAGHGKLCCPVAVPEAERETMQRIYQHLTMQMRTTGALDALRTTIRRLPDAKRTSTLLVASMLRVDAGDSLVQPRDITVLDLEHAANAKYKAHVIQEQQYEGMKSLPSGSWLALVLLPDSEFVAYMRVCADVDDAEETPEYGQRNAPGDPAALTCTNGSSSAVRNSHDDVPGAAPLSEPAAFASTHGSSSAVQHSDGDMTVPVEHQTQQRRRRRLERKMKRYADTASALPIQTDRSVRLPVAQTIVDCARDPTSCKDYSLESNVSLLAQNCAHFLLADEFDGVTAYFARPRTRMRLRDWPLLRELRFIPLPLDCRSSVSRANAFYRVHAPARSVLGAATGQAGAKDAPGVCG